MLDQFNKQVGVMTKDEALRKARELGVDIVEIAPKAVPPVAKLIDFSKFKYQQQQKEQDEKKKTKISEIKELRMTPVMAQGDFDVRMKKARKYLEDGDKVRLVVKFQGRQIARKDLGERVIRKAVEQLSDCSQMEIQPKLMGKLLMMQLTPVKKKKTQQAQTQQDSLPASKQTEE